MSLLQEAKGLLAATEDGAAECWAQRNLCQTAASALALLAAMVAELERLSKEAPCHPCEDPDCPKCYVQSVTQSVPHE